MDDLDDIIEQLELPEGMFPLEAADHAVCWWHTAPAATRPSRDAMINALGGMLGCVIREVSKFQWKRVVDEFGASFSLVAEDENAGPVVISPIDSVAKRFDSRRDGFMVEYFAGLTNVEEVRHFLNEDFKALDEEKG